MSDARVEPLATNKAHCYSVECDILFGYQHKLSQYNDGTVTHMSCLYASSCVIAANYIPNTLNIWTYLLVLLY